MVWRVPKIWEGGECWIIGGGPSMPRVFGVPESLIAEVRSRKEPLNAYSPYLSQIHDRHVIGVNAAFMIGNWVDMVLMGDSGFYFKNRRELHQYPKIRIACNANMMKRNDVHHVKFLARDNTHPFGISTRQGHVSWNLNTGAAAISLAHHLGVKRILLLGFDMKLGPDRAQHWHFVYGKNLRDEALPFHRHLKGFSMIAKDAKRLGIEILNLSDDTAIKEFKCVQLKDVL